jgi:hypothetical protein
MAQVFLLPIRFDQSSLRALEFIKSISYELRAIA